MKHIKLIKDEQVLKQISGGLTKAQSLTPVQAAVAALRRVFNRGFRCNRAAQVE